MATKPKTVPEVVAEASTLAADVAALMESTAPKTDAPAEAQVANQPHQPDWKSGDTLRKDGPTLAEYVAAGYDAKNYPPSGYLPNPNVPPQIKKYYEAQNSSQFKSSEGLQFRFSPYIHVGGTWMGTYVATDPVQIAALDKLAANPKSGVTELTEAEYDNCIKKKVVTSQSFGQSLIHSEMQLLSQQAAKPAALLDTEPQPPAPPAPPVEGIDSLVLGEAKVPMPAQ